MQKIYYKFIIKIKYILRILTKNLDFVKEFININKITENNAIHSA